MPQHIGSFKSRISIAAFLRSGHGLVAGRVTWRKTGDASGAAVLQDDSGSLPLPAAVAVQLPSASPSWAAIRLDHDGWHLVYQAPIAVNEATGPLFAKQAMLKRRGRIHQKVRRFFLNADFLECDTPVKVACPGMEPYLDTFAAGDQWLRTSPELHMKRLLAGGLEKVFQFAASFRAGDIGRMHREEFIMLEWYRLWADLDRLQEDVQGLFAELAEEATDPAYFRRPIEVVTCAGLFERYLDLPLRDHHNRDPLRACLEAKGLPWSEEDDWDTLYFQLFLNFIEPRLGFEQPTLVTAYPASQAALAKKMPVVAGEMPACYRFEIYVKGIELANAFYEVTDHGVQRARFAADQEERRALGKAVYPMDEAFLAALASGMPPAAGIALGLDRLVLALLGGDDLATILPF
ncbi:EF-P lysine aminoacylase EpmA [Acanthopleuribacter pedis]|uniref:EF-P lysine aminoacylase GenX n=1 Tax=Acanthopleuribacter pedis TaxID=442870 RepID=A0A8J7Q5U0_9BACT|nr:EF-P lysine aminoacylase EpmA [Acanthopleuribacter pedis]MBO1321007.1 EF-P lysine aminoacylase GenX [Acanthopleuribacter pedis]